MPNLVSSGPTGGSYQVLSVKCIEIEKEIVENITMGIQFKQKPTMWNCYFIKIIKKYQYTNYTNGTNGTDFDGFNKVTIYIFLSFVGSSYFSFYTNCIPNIIFSSLSFSILILFTDNKLFDPCRPTLVFTPFNISKYPTFAQCLI